MPAPRLFTLGIAAAGMLVSALALAAQASGPSPEEPAPAPEPPLIPYVCPEELHFGENALAPRRSPVSPKAEIRLEAGKFEGAVDGEQKLSDNVVVHQGDRRISADTVRVNPDGRSLHVEGNVEYRDPELQVRGRAGDYQEGAARIDEAQFELPRQPARGSASSLQLDTAGRLTLKGVSYTTCPRDVRGWRIAADDVSLDTRRQIGVARGARVEFMGAPILYLPWISFPAGPARKSGFLFPSMGRSSRGGLQFSAPYYFNLAPNYDLTATPTLYSRRGFDMGGEARFLGAGTRATLDGNFLPNDGVYGDDRSRVRLVDRSELPGDWLLRAAAENVSDVAYFEDFAQGADSTSIAFLPRSLQVSYRDDTWRAGALLRNFQTIDAGLVSTDRPYTELPRLFASGWWRVPGALPLEYGFDAETTGFHRDAALDGWRFDAQPQASLRFEGPGWFITPAAAWRSTSYALDRTTPGQTSSPSRNLPLLSLDTGVIFERATGSNGKRRMTLEPRLMYLYVPYRAQQDLPVFDTGVPDLNWVQLFRDNRYVGGDRVGDANQITAGLTTRLFASSSGARFLSATVGQTFYIEPPRVALPDEVLRGRQSSDLITQLELRAFRNWNVDLGMQWDHRENRAERSEIRVQYRPEGSRVVNVGYRFQRDRLEQADVSAAWPVSPQWRLYGRMLYSLRDDHAIEQFAGVEYGSCCWGLRAVARRYVSNRTGEQDTGYFLQLELKGLSNVGTAADAFLEKAIRGYSARP
jgi:LPS-assembly protein